MLSIIIPLYNKQAVIARTIESILSQSYINWELIIVDDGSTDGSDEVVRLYLVSLMVGCHQPETGVSRRLKGSGYAILMRMIIFCRRD